MFDADRGSAADLIAVQEGRSPVPLLDDAAIAALLRSRPRIAIVGASGAALPRVERRAPQPAPAGLRRGGGEPVARRDRRPAVLPSVAAAVAATGPVDVVDVFRRADQCVAHAREAVEAGAKVLWLQLGIANLEAGRIAHEAGLGVVMDRCTSIEAGRLHAWGSEAG